MRSRILFATLSLLILLACSLAAGISPVVPGTAPPSMPADSGLTIFISDLHLGVGLDPNNPSKWHQYEDFRWLDEFRLFLKEINRLGGGKTTLVLNGDVFELWQSLKDDCIYENKDLGCTEQEALGRIQRVITSHAAELQALGEFARAGDNRLIIIPGNHDAALLFPRVADAALQAISSPGRVDLITQGYWLSPDGLVYAEHGQQIGKEVNKWEQWPKPFIELAGKMYLQRPWGEKFVQAYYNAFELKYPIIDNISQEGEGIRYARAAEGTLGTSQDVAGFLNFFLFKVSWDQFTTSLKPQDGKPPEWDVDAIRGKEGQAGIGERFLVESLPTDHPFYSDASRALVEGKLRQSFQKLTAEDIKTICDERAALRQIEIDSKKLPTVSECPIKDGTLRAAGEALFRARDKVLGEHLTKTCLQLAECPDHPFMLFVYSHTHLAVAPYSPIKNGDWQPTVVNTGAWQRVVTPAQLDKIKKLKQIPAGEVLPKLEPEDLPACYSLISVEHQRGIATPTLMYWRRGKDSVWEMVAYKVNEDPCRIE